MYLYAEILAPHLVESCIHHL